MVHEKIAELVAGPFVTPDAMDPRGLGAERPVGRKGLEAGVDGDAVGVVRADHSREHGHGVEKWNLTDTGVCSSMKT